MRRSQSRVNPYSRMAYARCVRKSAKWSSRTSRSSRSAASARRPSPASTQASELLVADRGVAARRVTSRATRATATAATGDLGGGRVLHEVVDRRGADALQPGSRYARATRTLARMPASVTAPPSTAKSAARRRPRRLAERVLLVRPGAEHRSKTSIATGRDRGARPRSRRSHRATRAPCRRGPWPAPFGDLGVAAVRDERRHAADGVRAASVARPDEQLRVGPHERQGHRQLGPVRRSSIGTAWNCLMTLNR